MQYIDGEEIAKQLLKKTKRTVSLLKKRGITPRLVVVLVGDNKPSQTYVLKKQKAGESIGIIVDVYTFKKDIEEKTLIKELKSIQKKELHGMIIQLPLPKHLHTGRVLNTIDPSVDVDYLTYENLGKLLRNDQDMIPPTPGAILHILETLNVDVVGKNITLVGTGNLVGKPLSLLLMNRSASILTCNKQTKNLKKKCKQADIIITAVGKKDLIKKDMVKKGVIIIDAGVSFTQKKMHGDVDIKKVAKRASFITPTPGGVGPITVAKLIENTVIVAGKS